MTRLTAERLREIEDMALPKGKAVIAIAELLDEVHALRAELAGAEERGRQKERADVLHECGRTERTSTLDGDGAFEAFKVRIQRGDHVRTGATAADGGESQEEQ